MSGQMNKYDDDFKKSIVNLYHSGKSQTQLSNQYGISTSAIGTWIKMLSEVKIDNDTILTANQIKELQKRHAFLEEQNLILKKTIAIFSPDSAKDETLYTFCALNIPSRLFVESSTSAEPGLG